MAELPPLMAVIDLDETGLETDKIFDEIAVICQAEGILGRAALYDARWDFEATGGSFDTMGYLSQQGVSDEEIDGISAILGANEAGNQYLYDDTLILYDTLDELGMPNITVTWGTLGTQLPKLRATGLDKRPYLITDVKEKGILACSWRIDGGYRVVAAAGQVLMAKSGILLDDKPQSFKGLPEDWTGYLVRRKPPKPSQMGTVPPRVRTVPNLAKVTKSLVLK